MPGQPLHVVRQTIQADSKEGLDIAENELIRALAEAQPVIDEDREGFMTTREGKEYLHELHEQGRIETCKVVMVDMSGRRMRVPAYRLKA